MTPEFRSDLIKLLEDCAEYFGNHADAYHDGERYVPNKAMRLQQEIISIEARLEKQA